MKGELEKAVQAALTTLGIETDSIEFEHPADFTHGDFSTNVAMKCAKQVEINPRDLAQQIVDTIELPEGVEKIEVAGPGFINFHLTRQFFVDQVEQIVSKGEAWGSNDALKGQQWIIEHTSPNPNKAMHIGHLRNNITGMAMVRLVKACGGDVVSEAIDNNRGIAIAKLMWGYLKFARKDGATDKTDVAYWFDHQDEWQTPTDRGMRPDRFVDELYVLGNQDGESDPAIQQTIRDLVIAWEQEDSHVWKLWRQVLIYSHEGQTMTLNRLGSFWDHVWHEHEHYKEGKDLVEQGLIQGVFKKLEDGAILSQLESYNLPDTILQKSDGTALYITQDLALTKHKKEAYPQASKMIWVIGPDQSLAMQQMFAVCEQLGIGTREEYVHLAYGYMSIAGQGKMSSRKGTVLYIDEVIDQAKDKVLSVLVDRDIDDKETVADIVALGAIKYSILRAGRQRDIAFDNEQATRFEGDTGPYLQYAHTRALSVLEKAEQEKVTLGFTETPETVSDFEKILYRFPEIVERATLEYEPHYVTTYLTELASHFSTWYAEEKILDGSPESGYKLALTRAFQLTMQNGLHILGIKTPERM